MEDTAKPLRKKESRTQPAFDAPPFQGGAVARLRGEPGRAGLSIYDYLNYRAFLGDFYAFKKSLNPHYSHRLFAMKAGLRSTGYFSEVLSGRRHLSKAQAQKFAKAMDLGDKERIYFDLLVAFGRAKSEAARQGIYELMLKALPVTVQRVRQSQLEYFSKWYYVTVRETLAIIPVTGEGDELAEALDPPITEANARAAIRLLARLGLAVRDASGRWRATHKSLLSTDDPGAALMLRAFQDEMMAKAREALDRVPKPQRDISCVTMSVSSAGLARVKDLIADFHKSVLETVQSDRGEDRVIQLNLQVFPLTRIEGFHPSAEETHAVE